MEFAQQDICTLAEGVWQSILNLPIELAPETAMNESEMMAGCVQITGGWQGAVCLNCDSRLAARAASIMFGTEADASSKSEMQDALGELVNMIGGNLKGLINEPCQLSLPTLVDGSDYSLRIPRSNVILRVPLRCEGFALEVVIREKIAA